MAGTVEGIELAAQETAGERAQQSNQSLWRNFWILLLLCPAPLMVPYFIELWQLEWYQYFPFVFVAVGGLLYARSDRTFAPPLTLASWTAIGLGLLLVLLAALMRYPWFATAGFVAIALACLHSLKGPADGNLVSSGLPLLMLLRPPFRTDQVLVGELQSITTHLSSVMLDLLSVPHATRGNVLLLSDRELFVAEACSGIQSVFTLAFLACLLVSWKRIRLWLLPCYLLVAVLLAVATNTLRVTAIAAAQNWFALDLSGGWQHEVLGYVCLAIGIGLLFSFDEWIQLIFHPVEPVEHNPVHGLWNRIAMPDQDEREAVLVRQSRRREQAWGNRLQSLRIPTPMRYAFLALVILVPIGTTAQVIRSRSAATLQAGSNKKLFSVPADVLESFDGFVQIESHRSMTAEQNPSLGAYSDMWIGKAGDATIHILLSQPHSGWKELCVCYEGSGWNLVDRSETKPRLAEADDEAPSYAVGRFKLEQQADYNGYLYFSAIRPDGTVMEAPTRLGSLGTRFVHRFDYSGVWQLEDVMMLQMWIVSPRRLPPKVQRELEDDFARIRAVLTEQIAARDAASVRTVSHSAGQN